MPINDLYGLATIRNWPVVILPRRALALLSIMARKFQAAAESYARSTDPSSTAHRSKKDLCHFRHIVWAEGPTKANPDVELPFLRNITLYYQQLIGLSQRWCSVSSSESFKLGTNISKVVSRFSTEIRSIFDFASTMAGPITLNTPLYIRAQYITRGHSPLTVGGLS